MRSASRIVFVAAIAVGVVAATAVPGGAGGGPVSPHNTLTIVKEVVGTAPTGTTFTVQVNCVNGLGVGATNIPTVTFDATGTPSTPESAVFTPGATSTCTVTETVDGGASSVGYACVSAGNDLTDKNGTLVDCTADNVVHFTDVLGDSATITVTNTFVAPPTSTTSPPVPPVTQAVKVAPTFTG